MSLFLGQSLGERVPSSATHRAEGVSMVSMAGTQPREASEVAKERFAHGL